MDDLQEFVTGTCKGGNQIKFKFPNGYGASLIRDGYGSSEGLYEIAVLDKDGHLDYSTPVTNDVLGHLDEADVVHVLNEIKAL